MPGYGMPQQRGPRTAAEGAVDVVPSAGGQPRTGPPLPPPGSFQLTPPQQAMQMGPDTGYMPPSMPGGPMPGGMPMGGQMPVPIAGGMPPGGMGPQMGMPPDPIQQLIAGLRRQAMQGPLPGQAAPMPFTAYARRNGLVGGGGY